MKKAASKSHGFTLVELLVVIAIISILAAMLLPSINNALKEAKRVSCLNDRRSLGVCTLAFAQEYNDLTPHPVPGYSSGNRTMLHYRYGSWDAAWVAVRNGTLMAGQGTLAAFGYVEDPNLMFCADFDNKNINASTAWNTPAYNAQWQEMTDKDNNLGGYWAYTSEADMMWCRDPKETWVTTGTCRQKVTINYMNANWHKTTNVGPILYGCLNGQGDCKLWWDGSGKSSAISHEGEGINAVFCDGSGRWIPKEETGAVFGNSYNWGRSWDRTTATIAKP